MPALNFKTRFANLVVLGLKPHTIRAPRKVPLKVGDILYLYTGMRTKACRRLAVARCSAVSPIQITSRQRRVNVCEGAQLYPVGTLSRDWIGTLAVRDGFDSPDEFFAFFDQPRGRSFFGSLIEWELSLASISVD